MAGQTYAFRKTIRPIRPKPLIPTSVSDMIRFNLYQPERVRFGKRLVGREQFGSFVMLRGREKYLLELWKREFSAGRGEASFIFYFFFFFYLGKRRVGRRAIAGGLVSKVL